MQDAKVNLDQKNKEQMVHELYVHLDKYIMSVIATKLGAAKFEIFVKMSEEKRSQKEMEIFLKANLHDTKKVFADAFLSFRKLYLANLAASMESPKSP